MNIIKVLFLFLSLSFILPAYADTAEVQCGVTYENGVTIKEKDYDLCERDLAQTLLVLTFGKTILNDELDGFFTSSNLSTNIKTLGQTGNTASKIQVVNNAWAEIALMIASVGLFYQIIAGLLSIMQSGSSLNPTPINKNSIIKKLICYILITPVYGLNFAALLVIKAAFIGAMFGNYMFSTILSQELIKSSKVDIDPDISWNESDLMSNEIVKIPLIIERTKQQLLNQNFHTTSFFNEDYEDGDSGTDFDNYDEKIRECMSPYIKQTYTSNSSIADGYLIHSPQKDYCLEEFSEGKIGGIWDAVTGKMLSYRNDVNSYGNPHTIAKINYTVPDYNQMFHLQNGAMTNVSQVITGEDDVEGTVEDLIKKYKTQTNLKSFIEKNSASIYELIDAEQENYSVAEEIFKNKIRLQAEDFSNTIFNDISNNTRIEDKDEIFKANAIFAKSVGIYNALLGLNESSGDGDQYRLDGNTDNKFAILYLIDEARKASNHLENAHCAKSFFKLIQSQKTVIGMNNLSIDPSNEDLAEIVLFEQIPVKSFECIKVTGTEYNDPDSTEDYEFKYNIDNADIATSSLLELGKATERELFGFNDEYVTFTTKNINSEKNDKIRIDLEKKLDTYYLSSIREANKHKMAIKAYFYFVKRASISALGNAFKENTDTDLLIELRQLGFASAGAFLLKMSLSGGSAMQRANRVMSSVSYNSFGDSSTFVNQDALYSIYEEDKSENKLQSEGEISQLGDLISNGFFIAGQGSYTKSSITKTESEMAESNETYVRIFLDKLLFSSFDMLKQSNGFDVSKSIEHGLQSCKNGTGSCKGEMSAIAGFMGSGNALIEKAVFFYILQAILNIANNAVNGDGSETDNIAKTMAKFAGGPIAIVKIILGVVLKALTIFINTISVVFPIMLIVGFWCSFVLPTIPFVAFSMTFISWLILVITTVFVIQVQLVRAIFVDQDTNNALSFKFFWDLFGTIMLKPALMVISITIVFCLWDLIIFYMNSVFGYFSIFTRQEGNLLGIFFEFAFTILYLVIVSSLLVWGSLQIPTIVENILKEIGLNPSGDSQALTSTGVIAAMQTYSAKMLGDTAGNAASGAVNKLNTGSTDILESIRKKELERKKRLDAEEESKDKGKSEEKK